MTGEMKKVCKKFANVEKKQYLCIVIQKIRNGKVFNNQNPIIMKTNYLVKVVINVEYKGLPFKSQIVKIVSSNDLGVVAMINIDAVMEALDNGRLTWEKGDVAVVENETAKVTIEFKTLAVNGVPVEILNLLSALG